MKINKTRFCASIASFSMAALLASTSIAQPPEGGPRGPGGRPEGGPSGPGGMRGDPKMFALMLLEKFDKDGDKMLNSEELVAALTEMRQGGPGGFGGGPNGPGGSGGGPGGPGGFGGFGGGASPGQMLGRMFEQSDKDGDGKLSGDEIPERMRQNLAQVDANGDGAIDRAELEKLKSMIEGGGAGAGPGGFGGGAGAGQMATRLLEQSDKDGDGKLSGDEIPERMRQRLAQVDTNNDGAVDRAELERMMSNLGGGGNRPPRDGQPSDQGDRPRRPAAE